MKLYRAPSVEALTTDSDNAYKTSEGQFTFEKTYDLVGEMPVSTVAINNGVGFGWGKNMFSINGITTAIIKDSGGSLGTFENATAYGYNSAQDGQYIRRGSRFGGNASEGYVVLRYAAVTDGPSSASTRLGSGFRVQLAA